LINHIKIKLTVILTTTTIFATLIGPMPTILPSALSISPVIVPSNLMKMQQAMSSQSPQVVLLPLLSQSQMIPSQTPISDQPNPVIRIPPATGAMQACLDAGYSYQRCKFIIGSPDLGICVPLESQNIPCPAER
jgi:hypothetical protein